MQQAKRFRPVAMALVAIALLAPSALEAQDSADPTEQIMQLIRSNQCEKATELLDRELQLAPTWGYGHFLQGVCYQMKGLNEDAVTRFRMARENDPSLFAAYYQEAAIHYQSRNFDRAVRVLDKGLPKAASNEKAAGLRLKGKACALLKDYDCAVESLAPTAGDACEANYYLGFAHYGRGEWSKAVRPLDKASSRCSGETKARAQDLLAKARLNDASGDKAKYCAAMGSAKASLDAGQGSWKTYGEAALGCGEFADAERAFRKVLSSEADDCNARMNLGQALLGAKKYAEAERALGKAVGCLQGAARKNALVQLGFAQMGTARDRAKRYAGETDSCDTDVSGRESVIRVYQNVRSTFDQAGATTQVATVDDTIGRLRDQITTIRDNIQKRKENEVTRRETLRAWKIDIDLDRVEDSDLDGVPDEHDECPGEPSRDDPVDLDGCPYEPECPGQRA